MPEENLSLQEIEDTLVKIPVENKSYIELAQVIKDILADKIHSPLRYPHQPDKYFAAFKVLSYCKFADGLDLKEMAEKAGMLYEYDDKAEGGLFFSVQILTKHDADFVIHSCIEIAKQCRVVEDNCLAMIEEGVKIYETSEEKLEKYFNRVNGTE